MTSANELQYGGDHYKTAGPQHWDVIDQYGYPYLEGCATKYLLRHHKKNGREDLQKAHHFVIKIIEQTQKMPKQIRAPADELIAPDEVRRQLIDASGLEDGDLRACVFGLLGPVDLPQLYSIESLIHSAIDRIYPA